METLCNYHVGETVLSLQKATLIPGGSESLVYTTLSGGIGMLVPFTSREVKISCYYMASSASGQEESNPALWLATRAGKMELPCPLGTTRRVPQEKFPRKPYNKSFIDQACSVKMAGYWPGSFYARLWTSSLSRSINTQKKNLANIQPSWPNKLGQ